MEELVNLFRLTKDNNMSLEGHSTKVQEGTAKCRLVEVKAQGFDKTLSVAVFTYDIIRKQTSLSKSGRTLKELETFLTGKTEEMKKKCNLMVK